MSAPTARRGMTRDSFENSLFRVLRPIVIVLLVLTYAHPRAERTWARRLVDVGDHQAAVHGLGAPLASFLRRFPPTPRVDERTHRLDVATGAARSDNRSAE